MEFQVYSWAEGGEEAAQSCFESLSKSASKRVPCEIMLFRELASRRVSLGVLPLDEATSGEALTSPDLVTSWVDECENASYDHHEARPVRYETLGIDLPPDPLRKHRWWHFW
ncbi:MAG: hypothetical protein M3N31_09300 [Actinomycetota bacterium]|nr:hypothetical protein [Actinomycetota bacterium]